MKFLGTLTSSEVEKLCAHRLEHHKAEMKGWRKRQKWSSNHAKEHKEQKRQKVQCLLFLYAFAFTLLSPPHHSCPSITMRHLSSLSLQN